MARMQGRIARVGRLGAAMRPKGSKQEPKRHAPDVRECDSPGTRSIGAVVCRAGSVGVV